MSDKTFIDTNILIYAHDLDQKEKHAIARQVVVDLLKTGNAVVSPQVLQEFYVNVTRKLAKPLSKRIAREIVRDFSVWCVDTTADEVITAFRIEDESKIRAITYLTQATNRRTFEAWNTPRHFSKPLNTLPILTGLSSMP